MDLLLSRCVVFFIRVCYPRFALSLFDILDGKISGLEAWKQILFSHFQLTERLLSELE